MSKNIRQRGSGFTIQYVLGGTVVNGDTVLLGDQGLFGMALQGGVSGETISVLIPSGTVVSHAVLGHDGTSAAAIAIFDRVFFATGDAFYDVTAANLFVGYTLGAVASGATETELVLQVIGNGA